VALIGLASLQKDLGQFRNAARLYQQAVTDLEAAWVRTSESRFQPGGSGGSLSEPGPICGCGATFFGVRSTSMREHWVPSIGTRPSAGKNLALLYEHISYYAQAETLHRQALSTLQKRLGPEQR